MPASGPLYLKLRRYEAAIADYDRKLKTSPDGARSAMPAVQALLALIGAPLWHEKN
jgi:hypothetical protein